jgi:hypothetical protein
MPKNLCAGTAAVLFSEAKGVLYSICECHLLLTYTFVDVAAFRLLKYEKLKFSAFISFSPVNRWFKT